MIIDFNDKVSVEAAKLFCKNNKTSIGITSGSFDLFHNYHLDFLARCKRLCDVLIVGVDSDRLIKEDKGSERPIFNESHRIRIINSLKCVDITFVLDSLAQFGDVVETFVRGEYGKIFRNQEFAGDLSSRVVGNKWAKVIIVPDIEELTSTTDFIKRIQSFTHNSDPKPKEPTAKDLPRPIPMDEAAPGFKLVAKGEKGIGPEPGIFVDNSSE